MVKAIVCSDISPLDAGFLPCGFPVFLRECGGMFFIQTVLINIFFS